MSSAEIASTLEGETKFGFAPWKEDPLGTGEMLRMKRKQRGWEDEQTTKLAEGLEKSIQKLLDGEASEDLPWAQMPKREVGIPVYPPPFRY